MSDVKDILNISSEKTPSKIESLFMSKRKPLPKKKKPDGVSREVFALQDSLISGSSKPPVSPAPGVIFKEKRKIGIEKVNWSWKPFRNSARKDNFVFYHYARSDDKSEDYRFARFNKKLTLPLYNEEEYQQHFQDSNWTKEETDQLFDLSWRYDMRFVVVADRMSTTKTVDELKERFYSISTKMAELHALPEEDLSLNPLAHYSFNQQHEVSIHPHPSVIC
jgi:DNA methyltransferase 1-associated protein 1